MTGRRAQYTIGVLLCTLASSTFVANLSAAAPIPGAPDVTNKPQDVATLDLSVPESPAFAVLGVTPQTITRPTSPRAFASSLLNGVDANGNIQSGIAIDTAPYLLLAGDGLTLKDYRSPSITGFSGTRLAARTQMSIATAKGSSSDDKSLRLALGFRLTPWDEGDPRLDDKLLFGCLDPIMKGVLDAVTSQLTLLMTSVPPSDLALLTAGPDDLLANWKNLSTSDRQKLSPATEVALEQLESLQSSTGQRAEQCRAEARKRNWNRSAWDIGAAPSWISNTGTTDNINWDGGALWTSLAYGFESIPLLRDSSQLILQARYRLDEKVPASQMPAGTFLKQDSLLVGGRLRVGAPNFNVSIEGLFIHSDPKGGTADNSERLSVGADLKLTKDLWLELTVGGDGGRQNGNNQAFVLSSLKYGFASEPAFAAQH